MGKNSNIVPYFLYDKNFMKPMMTENASVIKTI